MDEDCRVNEAYVSESFQQKLFKATPREVCRAIGLNWLAALHLRDRNWLSFDPETKRHLNEPEEAELVFVGALVACGLDEQQLKMFLGGLRAPYSYKLNRLYYDWLSKNWKLLPCLADHHAIDIAERIENPKLNGEVETLQTLAEQIESALQELEEESDPNAEDR
jgi:hypothetical protein